MYSSIDLSKSYKVLFYMGLIVNKIVKINCSCDVLETYKEDVLNSDARFYRNIKTGDYVESDLNLSNVHTIEKFNSDVEFKLGSSMVLVTVEG